MKPILDVTLGASFTYPTFNLSVWTNGSATTEHRFPAHSHLATLPAASTHPIRSPAHSFERDQSPKLWTSSAGHNQWSANPAHRPADSTTVSMTDEGEVPTLLFDHQTESIESKERSRRKAKARPTYPPTTDGGQEPRESAHVTEGPSLCKIRLTEDSHNFEELSRVCQYTVQRPCHPCPEAHSGNKAMLYRKGGKRPAGDKARQWEGQGPGRFGVGADKVTEEKCAVRDEELGAYRVVAE